MLFGLINAGDTFHRAMYIVFRRLIDHCVVSYLYDVTVFSKKREYRVFHLKQIFDCCRKYDIYLNPNKSIFHGSGRKFFRSYDLKEGDLN